MGSWSNRLGQWVMFNLLFLVLAMFGLETRDPWSLSSAVWLPAGLLLGTLCTSPVKYWPVYGTSAALLHIFVSLHYGRALDVALTFSGVDLAVLFPLAMLWHSVYRYFSSMSYLKQTFVLLLGVYMGSVAGGVVSILMLTLLDYPVVLSHFFTWSLSNATGCLAVAPFFISRHFYKSEYRRLTWREGGILFITVMIFLLPTQWMHDDLLIQAMLYLVFGGTVLLAMFWPLHMSAVCFFFLTLLVSVSTLSGRGPFAIDGSSGIQEAQLYLLAVISLGLIASAHVKVSETRSAEHGQLLQLLCNMLEDKQPVFFRLSLDTGELHWSGNESVNGLSSQELSSVLLLLARIHPEERHDFAKYIECPRPAKLPFRPCYFRILLSDSCYYQACCSMVYDRSLSAKLGVIMLCHSSHEKRASDATAYRDS